MNRYETIFILDPDVPETERGPFLDRMRGLISEQGGFVAGLEEWGVKKLAYEVKKKQRGYYVRADYCGTGPLVGEMERQFRIDDKVLRFMTVQIAAHVSIENIKEELAVAAAKAAEPPQSEASAAGETPSGASEDTAEEGDIATTDSIEEEE
jgi:small subunit ribosomal protein S6